MSGWEVAAPAELIQAIASSDYDLQQAKTATITTPSASSLGNTAVGVESGALIQWARGCPACNAYLSGAMGLGRSLAMAFGWLTLEVKIIFPDLSYANVKLKGVTGNRRGEGL